MKRLAFSVIGLGIGYILGAVAGYGLVSRSSSNAHDRPVEAAMTGAFVSGPLGAILGGLIGFRSGRPSAARRGEPKPPGAS